MRTRHSLEQYRDGILAGDRTMLAKAITLVESLRADDRALGRELVRALAGNGKRAQRIGITGVPGVGKSTFLDAFGTARCNEGHRVAVLAVDPSSEVSGGSILGDKTRMAELARHPNAYIRPSPSGLSLGGVARRTREAIALCEAAGFDLIFVETVGVGQSETTVAGMVDVFVFLALPGAGDELQGIKKGILELADLVVVHKADGDARKSAEEAQRTHESAMHYARGAHGTWQPRALLASSRTGEGLEAVWAALEAHRAAQEESGDFARRRRSQETRAFWQLVEEGLRAHFDADPAVRQALPEVLAALAAGTVDAGSAADGILTTHDASARSAGFRA
jgi:LAO/AO transport system kinase